MALQVWLPLNGDLTNQGLSDISVINNGATVSNDGKIGKCYYFDGSDDYINLGNISNYFDGSPFSICFWIKSQENNTRGVIFSGYGLTSTSNCMSIEINSGSVSNNSLRLYWNGGQIDWFSSADFVTPNEWIHCAVIYDGTSVFFYKNGAKITTKTGTLSTIIPGNNYYLGRDSRTGTYALDGYLNDFRLYDTALSPREVKEISKGLVRHYTLSGPTPKQLYGEDFTYVDGTAIISDELVEFNSPRNLNISSCVLDIEPSQNLSDDISPDNIYPISGISSLWFEHRTKNLWHNDDFIYGSVQKNSEGWYYATSLQWRGAFLASSPIYGLFHHEGSLNLPQITISLDYYTPQGVSTGNKLAVYCSYADGSTSSYLNCYSEDSNGGVVHKKLTTRAGKLVSRIHISYGTSCTVYVKNFQIELGDKETPFEDGEAYTYAANFTNSAGTVYGGSYNYITGELNVTHLKKTITAIDGKGDNYGMSILGSYGTTVNGFGMCNMLKKYTGTASAMPKGYFNNINSNGYQRDHVIFSFPEIDYTSAAYNAKLTELNNAGTPLEVIYQLITPQTYQLTAQQMKTLSGKNIMFSNGETITIADPRINALGINDNIEYDVSGYMNNGTKTAGITYLDDTARYNASSSFDGSTTYIEALALPAETKTISLWCKNTNAFSTSTSTYYHVFLDPVTKLACSFTGGNPPRLITYVGTSSGSTGSSVSAADFVQQQWNHIVVVVTGANTRIVYINGVQQSVLTGNYWATDQTKMMIGARHQGGAYKNYFNGQVCDFRAYATALSEADILELYHTPISLSQNGTLLTQGEIVEA